MSNFTRYSLFYFLIIVFSVGCGDNFFYDKTQLIQETGWDYKDTLTYEVDIKDTLKLYNLSLALKHTKDYPSQNIYIQIHTKFPSGQRFSKRVNIDFSEPSGRWYGDCSGDNCTLSVDIQKGAYFNEVGTYTFTIEQYTRINPLPSVNKVRFMMKDVGERKS